MELKIYVDQTVRIVCGLNEHTTVHDVILALAQALKQTGRFYLIECWSGASNTFNGGSEAVSTTPSRIRIMSPKERPIQLLKCYSNASDSLDDVEFHLIRTSMAKTTPPTTSNLAATSTFNSLLFNIYRQQYVLNEQSVRLNDLVESIRFEEAKSQNKLDNEYIKRKLFHLDLKSKLNERKLKKITGSKQYNDVELRREAELNEFLRAQIDYYKRKLDTTKRKWENTEQEYGQLKLDYDLLSKTLLNESNTIESYNQAMHQFEINMAKLDYLDAAILSLDENMFHKKEILTQLENEYDSALTTEVLKSSSSSSSQAAHAQQAFDSIWTTETMSSSSDTESSSGSVNSSAFGSSSGSACKSSSSLASKLKKKKLKSLAVNFNPEDIYFF